MQGLPVIGLSAPDIVALEPEKSNCTIDVLSAFPLGGAASLSLRCLRRKATGKAVFGVWSREKGFRAPKGVDEKLIAGGAVTVCSDGSTTGVFVGKGPGAGLEFTHLEHNPAAPRLLLSKPRSFAVELNRALGASGKAGPGASHSVVACTLCSDTPSGPIVAAILKKSTGAALQLVLGHLRSGGWKTWELGGGEEDGGGWRPCGVHPPRRLSGCCA